MATLTNEVASFASDQVLAYVDYNSTSLFLTKGRVVNNTTQSAFLYAVLDPPVSGFSTVGITALPQTTTEADWPNNVIKYTRDSDGSLQLVGVSLFCRWPAEQ